MDSDASQVLVTTGKPKTSPGYRFGGAGPGRPKGRGNNTTDQGRQVVLVSSDPRVYRFEHGTIF